MSHIDSLHNVSSINFHSNFRNYKSQCELYSIIQRVTSYGMVKFYVCQKSFSSSIDFQKYIKLSFQSPTVLLKMATKDNITNCFLHYLQSATAKSNDCFIVLMVIMTMKLCDHSHCLYT